MYVQRLAFRPGDSLLRQLEKRIVRMHKRYLAGGNRRRFSSHVLHPHNHGHRRLRVGLLLADGDNPLHRLTDRLCIELSLLRGVRDGFDARLVVEPVCLVDRE